MARVRAIDYKRIIRSKYLVRFKRKPLDESTLYGFVLACSDTLTLLNILETSSYTLNGYSVIRNQDVSLYAVYDRPDYYFDSRVLKLKGIKPVAQPEISVANLPDLLTSVDKQYPLTTIHRELLNDQVCNIGRLTGITEKTFTLYELDASAEWFGSRRYRFADVTRVDFGGGYEEALAMVARPDMRLKPKKRKARLQ
jgi:hypothetical protein